MGDATQRGSGWNWGYLIKPDKTAAPLLEQLCAGLARIICKLGPGRPGPEHELKPEQLATFYRSVGGNLDALFLGPTETGLTFLYRTLGCFHSLEPTPNPFKTPSIACLTPAGFVRWQTIQLLLCPDEHASCLQQAVKLYDVPRPGGGFFPKSIPREAFPLKPDAEMEEWYSHASHQLKNQQTRRLKNSPHASPNPHAFDGREGYFGLQVPTTRRISRNSKSRSPEEGLLRPEDARRRSEPYIPSPGSTPSTRPPTSYHRDGKTRNPSLQREMSGSRPRSATIGDKPTYQSQPSYSSQRRDVVAPRGRPANYAERSSRNSPRENRMSRPTSAADESAEEASSEDSVTQRQGRLHDVSPRSKSKQKTSLFTSISNPFSSHKRRHSHDAIPVELKGDSRKRHEDVPRSERHSPAGSSARRPPHVRLQNESSYGSKSAQVSPIVDPRFGLAGQQRRVYPRTAPAAETEFPAEHLLSRERSSGSGTDGRSGYESQTRSRRKDSIPLRVSTVQGVGGRQYINAGPQSAGALPIPALPQQDTRARYSTAV